MLLMWACSPEIVATELMVANPLLDLERVDAEEVQTRIEERVDAGGYMYLRTEFGWVASLRKPVAVGDRVGVKTIGIAKDFHSSRTDRTFSRLHFAVVRAL